MNADQERTPRERRRERTKQVILQAAESLLAEGGLQNTTLANIAHRAEYSKPAIYEYFGSLEEILIELSNNGFIRLGECLKAVDASLPPDERLLAAGSVYLQFAAENPELYQLMFTHIIFTNSSLDRDWDEIQKKTQVAYYAAAEIIHDGIEQGIFKTREGFDSGVMLYVIWVALHGMASLKRELVREVELDVDQHQGVLFQLLLNNLKGIAPGE